MRHLSYLRVAFEMSIFRSLEYRWGVAIQYALDMMWYVVQFALLRTAYEYVPELGGYSLQEAYVFLGFLYALDAFNMVFFEGGITHFTRTIRRGTLDFYLLKPMSTLFQVTVARVNLSGFFNLIFTAAFWIYVFVEFKPDYPLERWALALALFANGLLLNVTFRLSIASSAFWTTEGGTLNWLFHELMRFGTKPESVYPRDVRLMLSTFVPVLLINAWPVLALVREPTPLELAYPFLVGGLSVLLLRFIWRRGVRRYEGLSFQQ